MNDVMLYILTWVSGFILAVGIMGIFTTPNSTLIKQGLAEYNQTTGDFQLKTVDAICKPLK